MTERKKKIASLILASSLLISATGCTRSNIKQNIDENKNITYSGDIDYDKLKYLYIVEITNVVGERKLYLTIEEGGLNFVFYALGTKNIVSKSVENSVSSLGIVTNILEFQQFIPAYLESDVKDTYSAEEIIDVFQKVKDNYDEILENENIKKLRLK